jgi:hypothetical protein
VDWSCDFFSYPHGERDDLNAQSKRVLKELGFRCALTTVIGANNRSADVYERKRLHIHDEGTSVNFSTRYPHAAGS